MSDADDAFPLIDAADAFASVGNGRAVLVDATWRLDQNAPPRQGPPLPGAVRFELDEVTAESSELPHMAPDRLRLAQWAYEVGLPWGAPAIIYDDIGLFSAPRVWWTLRHCGWTDVRVLNGGRPAWIAAGLPLEISPQIGDPPPDGAPDLSPRRRFSAASLDDVKAALREGAPRILDARPATRFAGDAPEPRGGLRSGHMPGAINIPYKEILTPEGELRPVADLDGLFSGLGLGRDSAAIATCGSGVTAAIIILALEATGRRAHSLYDGSWAEWGAPNPAGDRPVRRSAGPL